MKFPKAILAVATLVLFPATVVLAAGTEYGHNCDNHRTTTTSGVAARHEVATDNDCEDGCESTMVRELSNGEILERGATVTPNADGTYDVEMWCPSGQAMNCDRANRVSGRLIFGTLTCSWGNPSNPSGVSDLSCG